MPRVDEQQASFESLILRIELNACIAELEPNLSLPQESQ
jgi:hypothetical protein